ITLFGVIQYFVTAQFQYYVNLFDFTHSPQPPSFLNKIIVWRPASLHHVSDVARNRRYPSLARLLPAQSLIASHQHKRSLCSAVGLWQAYHFTSSAPNIIVKTPVINATKPIIITAVLCDTPINPIPAV